MKNIYWKDGEDEIYMCLGIPESRSKKMLHRMHLIMHNLNTPHENPEENIIQYADIVKLFIAIAQNEQELIYCSFMAGRIIGEMQAEDYFDEQWEEEM